MNGTLHDALKRVKILRAVVRAAKSARAEFVNTLCGPRLDGSYTFDDRSKGSDTMLIVLAGYKPDLWEAVFGRLRKFLPDGVDVCVATSGKSVERLRDLCSECGWSYLSTVRNNISYAQNTAIRLHASAKWIFKMDEDMFLTQGACEKLKRAYLAAPAKISAEVGFVAPLIPINGYGHVRILRRLGLESAWEKKFGRLMYTEGLNNHTSILKNPDAARFMWGDTDPRLRGIDALNDFFSADAGKVSVCPYRFSIGFLLFERSLWTDMGGFYEDPFGSGLGLDEEHICKHCMIFARAIVVAEDTVVGHFSYGPQTASMLQYMKSNTEFSNGLLPQLSHAK